MELYQIDEKPDTFYSWLLCTVLLAVLPLVLRAFFVPYRQITILQLGNILASEMLIYSFVIALNTLGIILYQDASNKYNNWIVNTHVPRAKNKDKLLKTPIEELKKMKVFLGGIGIVSILCYTLQSVNVANGIGITIQDSAIALSLLLISVYYSTTFIRVLQE